jgi:AcrR family transcriptional regulator
MGRPKRTPAARTALSRERIVETAIALADAGGLEALTMRRLGDELGTSAMALYYHVPNKEDLVDAMVDVVFGQIDLPTTDVDWRTAMRRRAHSTRAALRRHRWAVGYMEGRTTPGPANLRLHDAVLGCLRGAGFSVAATVYAYSVQDAYIYGFALQERSLPFEDAEGGAAVAASQMQDYDAREAERQLGELAETFPHLAEVVAGHVAEVGYDFDAAFADGLDLILDALERRRQISTAVSAPSGSTAMPHVGQ